MSGADPPPCCRCEAAADFWLYRSGDWQPRCERHVVHAHPSIELRAWLESGYAKPVERGRPEGPPADPAHGRAAAFRELVEGILD